MWETVGTAIVNPRAAASTSAEEYWWWVRTCKYCKAKDGDSFLDHLNRNVDCRIAHLHCK